jgi:DNA-binding NtrC family response regulator
VPALLDLLARARRHGLILLFEDDAALADNLSEALRGQGYSVLALRSLDELPRLTGAVPFAGLLDLRLPGVPDGAAVGSVASRFPALPLIAMTAHDDVAPPSGVGQVLRKPFHIETLLGLVEELHRAARPNVIR